jgi:hypothetical protein
VLRGAIGGEALGEQSNAAEHEHPGDVVDQHPSDQAPRRSTERASQENKLSCVGRHKKRKRALNVKRQRHGRLVSPAQRWTAKKEPRAVHSRALQLARLTHYCPGDFGGVGGRGKSPEGPIAVGNLPDPAIAIRDGKHILEL